MPSPTPREVAWILALYLVVGGAGGLAFSLSQQQTGWLSLGILVGGVALLLYQCAGSQTQITGWTQGRAIAFTVVIVSATISIGLNLSNAIEYTSFKFTVSAFFFIVMAAVTGPALEWHAPSSYTTVAPTADAGTTIAIGVPVGTLDPLPDLEPEESI